MSVPCVYGEQMQEMTSSQARFAFPSIQDAAASHEPTRITRRRGTAAVLVSEDDFRALLDRFVFSPEVFFENASVSIWLPELSIWGRGRSFCEAQDDLLDEIDQLLALVSADQRMRTAPETVERLPCIYRLAHVKDDASRLALLFATPKAEPRPAMAGA